MEQAADVFPVLGQEDREKGQIKPKGGRSMTTAEKKGMRRSDCSFRVCGKMIHRDPKPSREKVIGDEEQIHISCPFCVAKKKGK